MLVSVAILLTYLTTNQSLNRVLTGFSLLFCTVSSAAALTWGILRLGQVYRKPPSLRTKRQSGLMALGLAALFVTIIPLYLFYLTDVPLYRFVQSMPYLGLGGVALIAYAILRYQLFSSKSRILTILLVTVLCVLAANLVYLAIGQSVSFLPILAAAAVTGVVLQTRRGPAVMLDRLLRRETLDYQTVARFSQQVGALPGIDTIVAATSDCLRHDLDTGHVSTWLWDQERQTVSSFSDAQPAGAVATPPGWPDMLLAHPDPLPSAAPEAAELNSLLAGQAGDVAVWAPLVDRGQAVGCWAWGPAGPARSTTSRTCSWSPSWPARPPWPSSTPARWSGCGPRRS